MPRATPSAKPGLTIADALKDLEAEGYTGQFLVRSPRTIECTTCHESRQPAQVSLDRTSRIEGESDPADEAVVAGLTCPCGAKGTMVFTYGSAGSPEEEAVFSALTDGRQRA
jgi:hypothetical protein